MIELSFDQETASERHETLALHVGERITIQPGKGSQVEGTLTKVSPRAVMIQLDDGKHTSKMLSELRVVWVHVGGDWITTRGHVSGSMTERIHVRCTPDEKLKLAAYAQATNVSLSELMRQAAIRALRQQASKQTARKGDV